MACSAPKRTQVPSFAEAHRQALKEAPFTLNPLEVRQGYKCSEKPVAISKKKIPELPHTGVLFTNNRTLCLKAVETERNRLRVELEAERLRARTKQIINDAAYKRMAEETRQSWWDRHAWKVLTPVILTAGAALAIGIMYAVTGGKPVNTSATTNAHILP